MAGFGGGVPADTFDEVTETKVKNFQRDYMKMKSPTGVVDEETAKAIDEFGEKYELDEPTFFQLKCKCGQCSGFGKGRHRGEYSSTTKDEAYHKYEYPGVHRSLLWGITALRYHLQQHPKTGARFFRFSSGYRCHDHDIVKRDGTTNHMGKAADILFYSGGGEEWTRPEDTSGRNKTVESVRKLCTEADGLQAQYKWAGDNRFSMETTDQGASTWVHIDVRKYNSAYLSDRFFADSYLGYKGQFMEQFSKGI